MAQRHMGIEIQKKEVEQLVQPLLDLSSGNPIW